MCADDQGRRFWIAFPPPGGGRNTPDTPEPSVDNGHKWEPPEPCPWAKGVLAVQWMLSLSVAQERRGRPVVRPVADWCYVTPARLTFDRLLRVDPRQVFDHLQFMWGMQSELPRAAIEAQMASLASGYPAAEAFLQDVVLGLQWGAELKADDPEKKPEARAQRVDLGPLFTERGWSEPQLALWHRVFAWVGRIMALPFPARCGFVELDVTNVLKIASGDEAVLGKFATESARQATRSLRSHYSAEPFRDAIRIVCEALAAPTLHRVVAELLWYGKEVLQGDDDFYADGAYSSRIGLCAHCGRPFVRMRCDQRYCHRSCLKAEERTSYTRAEPRRLRTRPYDSAGELPVVLRPDDAAICPPPDVLSMIMAHFIGQS